MLELEFWYNLIFNNRVGWWTFGIVKKNFRHARTPFVEDPSPLTTQTQQIVQWWPLKLRQTLHVMQYCTQKQPVQCRVDIVWCQYKTDLGCLLDTPLHMPHLLCYCWVMLPTWQWQNSQAINWEGVTFSLISQSDATSVLSKTHVCSRPHCKHMIQKWSTHVMYKLITGFKSLLFNHGFYVLLPVEVMVIESKYNCRCSCMQEWPASESTEWHKSSSVGMHCTVIIVLYWYSNHVPCLLRLSD